MMPGEAAIQLVHVWRSISESDSPYPVDCRLLAECLEVKVHEEAIDDQFEAMLAIRGKTRVIIYNENIREKGRKNFASLTNWGITRATVTEKSSDVPLMT